MAEGALDSDGAKSSLRIDEAGQAHNRVQLEEGYGRCGILEIHFPEFQCRDEVGGKRVDVHLEANGERGSRTYSWAYAAKLCAFDGLMELESVAPEGFVAECVETESLLALFGHLPRVFTSACVESERNRLFRLCCVFFLGYQRKTNEKTA